MTVVNAASALGEAVGKLIEDEIENTLKPLCTSIGYYYDREGPRPNARKGVKLSMVNRSGNKYQLDGVIETKDGKPIILIESKYLRYKKHNRDKASWTCSAHYSLRKSHPSIRKSIAVLSGNWSLPSKKFMESFGIELYEIPFDYICNILAEHKIDFNWPEKNRKIPDVSWAKFDKLNVTQKKDIGRKLLNPIKKELTKSIKLALDSAEDWAKRLTEIELLLKTERNEYLTYSFQTVRATIQFLLSLQIDSPDIKDLLK